MAIRIQYQPAPGALGAAGFMAGQTKAKERYQRYMMDLQRQGAMIAARRQEQQNRLAFEGQREVFRQREQARESGLYRQHQSQMQEDRFRQYREQDEAKLTSNRYDVLSKQLEQIQKQAGGFWANTDEANAYKTGLASYVNEIARLQKTGEWDEHQLRKEAIPKLFDLVQGFREEFVVPPKDRPGATYTDEYGDRWRKSPDPSKPDEYIGASPDATDEQKARRKARRDASWEEREIDGRRVWGQYLRDRYGNQIWTPAGPGGAADSSLKEVATLARKLFAEKKEVGGIAKPLYDSYPKAIEEAIIRINAERKALGMPPVSVPTGGGGVLSSLGSAISGAVSGLMGGQKPASPAQPRSKGFPENIQIAPPATYDPSKPLELWSEPNDPSKPLVLVPLSQQAELNDVAAPTSARADEFAAASEYGFADTTARRSVEAEYPSSLDVPTTDRTPGGRPLPRRAHYLEMLKREGYAREAERPVTITGSPVAPPKSKEAENMLAKGYEYVPRLNSKGKKTGANAWRKTPEQTVAMHNGETLTGRVYRDGDSYTVKTSAGETVKVPVDEVRSVGEPGIGSPVAGPGPPGTGQFFGGEQAVGPAAEVGAVAPSAKAKAGKMSPDGKWVWDGTKWVPAGEY